MRAPRLAHEMRARLTRVAKARVDGRPTLAEAGIGIGSA
jgi:hypothetical protein